MMKSEPKRQSIALTSGKKESLTFPTNIALYTYELRPHGRYADVA